MSALHLHHADYVPEKLLNVLIDRLNVNNDAGLSRVLGIAPPLISKIRHRHLGVSAHVLIAMHEESDLSIRELRPLMGDRREHFGSIPGRTGA